MQDKRYRTLGTGELVEILDRMDKSPGTAFRQVTRERADRTARRIVSAFGDQDGYLVYRQMHIPDPGRKARTPLAQPAQRYERSFLGRTIEPGCACVGFTVYMHRARVRQLYVIYLADDWILASVSSPWRSPGYEMDIDRYICDQDRGLFNLVGDMAAGRV